MISGLKLTVLALLPALTLAQGGTQVQINPNGDTTQCLTVIGDPTNSNAPYNGALIETTACDDSNSNQLWTIEDGNNPSTFTLWNTNFCVDAGDDPANLVRAKIWTCYAGLPQQTWYYTNDFRIAITGGTQCLDSGGSSGLTETYQCTTGDTNQIWTTNQPSTCSFQEISACPNPVTPCCQWMCEAALVPFSFCSPTNTTGEFSLCTPCGGGGGSGSTPGGGQQIHYNGGDNCLTVMEGTASEGNQVLLDTCLDPTDQYYFLQQWVINHGSGAVQLAGTNYCLDAGSNPANGGIVKIWTCYPGLYQQTWYYTTDDRIAITGGTQCLDYQLGSGPTDEKPTGSTGNVQTWQCTAGDVQQIWTV